MRRLSPASAAASVKLLKQRFAAAPVNGLLSASCALGSAVAQNEMASVLKKSASTVAAAMAAFRLHKLKVAEVLRGCQVIGFGDVSRPWTPKRRRRNAADRGDRKRRDVAPARPHHRRLGGARKLIIPGLAARRVGCLRY